MLVELAIRNFAIVRDLRIPFSPGVTVITGETGAGKSIVIDALGAVLGQRVSADFVRSGAAGAYVEGIFDVQGLLERPEVQALLESLGAEPEEGRLVLARDINANGRSVARINGRTVTAGALNTLGGLLVDIHGQSEHLSLLKPALQLDLLDRYAGTLEARAELAGLVREHDGLRRGIDAILTGERERAQRIDLLRFQVDEIAAARLEADEEEVLERERAVLVNAERLARLATEAHGALEGGDPTAAAPLLGALDSLRLAVERVDELSRIDRSGEALAAQLREVQFLLEDCATSLRGYAERVEADPARLAAVDERLALVRQLKRKYGASVAEVIAFAATAARELESLEGSEARIADLSGRAQVLSDEIATRAQALSERRRARAADLESAVEEAIAELNMGRARFVVDFDELAGGARVSVVRDGRRHELPVDATGIDRVEFLIAPNAGEEPRPLARIASGGETARLMLALKSILSGADQTPTLVFDEVDVGVGGRSGQPVGERLWSLGDQHQVLVISHLPQVAAFAETHYRIAKEEREGRTETLAERLDAAERVDELAAMLDGQPVTPASRENARAMLERIEAWKQRAAPAGVV